MVVRPELAARGGRGLVLDQGLRDAQFIAHIHALACAPSAKIRIEVSAQRLQHGIGSSAPRAVAFKLSVARPDKRPFPAVFANNRAMSIPAQLLIDVQHRHPACARSSVMSPAKRPPSTCASAGKDARTLSLAAMVTRTLDRSSRANCAALDGQRAARIPWPSSAAVCCAVSATAGAQARRRRFRSAYNDPNRSDRPPDRTCSARLRRRVI